MHVCVCVHVFCLLVGRWLVGGCFLLRKMSARRSYFDALAALFPKGPTVHLEGFFFSSDVLLRVPGSQDGSGSRRGLHGSQVQETLRAMGAG